MEFDDDNELAEVDPEEIDSLVDGLISRGFLDENPSDSRLVRVTEKGELYIDELLQEAAMVVFGMSEDDKVSQILAHFNEFEVLNPEDLLVSLEFEKQDEFENLKEYLKDKKPTYKFH
jgi:hypothetical protein